MAGDEPGLKGRGYKMRMGALELSARKTHGWS